MKDIIMKNQDKIINTLELQMVNIQPVYINDTLAGFENDMNVAIYFDGDVSRYIKKLIEAPVDSYSDELRALLNIKRDNADSIKKEAIALHNLLEKEIDKVMQSRKDLTDKQQDENAEKSALILDKLQENKASVLEIIRTHPEIAKEYLIVNYGIVPDAFYQIMDK